MTADLADILTEHANAIRALGKRVTNDLIEIGRRLSKCRTILKEDGRWRAWLESKLRLSPQTAGRFIQVYERRSNLEHIDLPISSVYLLAAPSTPDSAATEVIERARAGESLPVAEVKRIVERHKGTKHRKQPTKQNRPVPKSRKPPPPPAPTAAGDDTSSASDENARLSARVEELQDQKRQLEIKNEALKSEIEDLKSCRSPSTTTRGPRPLLNETLVRLSALIAGRGPSGERFVREALIEHAKQIIASGVGDIETARRVLEKFTQREVAQ